MVAKLTPNSICCLIFCFFVTFWLLLLIYPTEESYSFETEDGFININKIGSALNPCFVSEFKEKKNKDKFRLNVTCP